MTIDADKAAVAAVLAGAIQALHSKDAEALNRQFASNAVIFDLAPPLAHGPGSEGLAAWFETWAGPVDRVDRDMVITVSGDMAVCHGLSQISAVTREGGHHARWWQRATICLSREAGGWTIFHEHTSVPFHMDGSFRAATDLEP